MTLSLLYLVSNHVGGIIGIYLALALFDSLKFNLDVYFVRPIGPTGVIGGFE